MYLAYEYMYVRSIQTKDAKGRQEYISR